jgi:hypothetical protein
LCGQPRTLPLPPAPLQVWLNINRPGVFYGQCSELCGANHSFMPIVVEAITPRQVCVCVCVCVQGRTQQLPKLHLAGSPPQSPTLSHCHTSTPSQFLTDYVKKLQADM